ncbi:S8 family serine peptidase, partial [uncultured Thiodictyon sp.]|uniref:S8 family serine peptidase n=1 Tax=uncultured Thiodictyon sp. TaxID=1846217 RepID=UPI0025F034E6
MWRFFQRSILIRLAGGSLLLGAGGPAVWAQFAAGPEYYNQPGLATINALGIFGQGYSGNGVNIGVVDSGIDPGHVEFAGKIVAGLGWNWDGTQWLECQGTTAACLTDKNFDGSIDGHGSFVSSVAAAALDLNARPNNIMGVAYNSKLVIGTIKFGLPILIKGVNPDPTTVGGTTDEQDARAIDFVSSQGVKVINNSWGINANWNTSLTDAAQGYLTTYQNTTVAALKRAQDRGAVLVFAAGNESVGWPGTPATLPSVDPTVAQKGGWIVVAATTNRGFDPATGQIEMAQTRPNLTAPAVVGDAYTNYCGAAAAYCISAPGGFVEKVPNRDTGMVGAKAGTVADYSATGQEGTSYAAPVVTGAVALVAEKFPWMSSKNLGVTILTTGTTAANPSPIWGRGMLDVGKAMNGPGIFEEDFVANITAGYTSTFANSISGPAGLIQSGTGTLVVSGTNTYAGVTTIANGTLQIGAGGTTGTLGAGAVANSGQLVFNRGDALTVTNAISGTGAVTQSGTGTTTLTANNTYSGSTTISNGTLALTGGGSIANSSWVVDYGTFDISGTPNGATIANLSGTGAVALGSQSLTFSARRSNLANFAGTIGGTGGVTVNGGYQALSGVNTYTGQTLINSATDLAAYGAGRYWTVWGYRIAAVYNGGILALTGAGSIASSSGVVDNGTFDISDTTNGATIAALFGNGVVALGAQSLTFSGANGSFGAFAGTIGGTGGVTVNGGYQALSGVNTYTGQTLINGGTLALTGAGSIASSGGVVDNGIFDISGTTNGATIAALFGNGVVALGAQSLTFSGANSNIGAFAGTIGGTGSVTVNGGYQALSGINTYTGQTLINGGTLALAGAGSIASSSGVWDYGTFDISGTANGATITGLFGNGVVALGAQSLTFSGANGSLGNFTGTIFGTGGLTFNSGYQALFGTNAYSGVTTVNGGTLAVNGSLSGPVNIGPAGTLRGTGILYAATTVSGTLAPGNSPGTLTSIGTVTMNPGSTYQEDIDGTGTANGANNYSRLLVTGAGSQFIANGTLRPLLRGITGAATNAYTPALGDTFAIISASSGIQGRFGSVVQPAAGLASGTQLDVFYNAYGNNRVDLIATPSSYGNYAWSNGANANGQAAGGALDTLRTWDGAGAYNTQEVNLRYAVAGQRAAQIPGLLTALAGEVHGAMAAAAPAPGRWLQNTVVRHLDTTPDQGSAAGVRLWVELNAGEGRARGGQISSDYKARRSHFALGADLLQGPNYRFGLGVTYTDINVSPDLGSGTVKETAPFLYGQYALNTPRPVVVDALLAYGFSTWRTNRSDPLGLAGGLSTKANGEGLSVGLGVRSPFAVSAVRIEPFARLLWQDSQRGALNEGLTSPAGLVLAGYKQNGTRVMVGATLEPSVAAAAAGHWSYRASLAIGEDFGQLVRPTVSANLAGAGYTIDAPHVGRTFAQLDVSATYRVLKNASIYGALMGEARTNLLDGGISAGFNYQF